MLVMLERGAGPVLSEPLGADCDQKARLYCPRVDFKCHQRAKTGEACSYSRRNQKRHHYGSEFAQNQKCCETGHE